MVNNTFIYSYNNIMDEENNEHLLNLYVSSQNISNECQYYDYEDLGNIFNIHNIFNIYDNNNFSILHLNARSIIYNHDKIMNMLDTIGVKFSIIIITETWLNTNNINLFNIHEYNYIHTIRKNGRGGGVSIHILDNIKYDIIDNMCYSNNICEIATIKILSNNSNSNIIVIGIYTS